MSRKREDTFVIKGGIIFFLIKQIFVLETNACTVVSEIL